MLALGRSGLPGELRPRRAAALMTVVVTIALLALLAVVAAPALAGYNELKRATDTQVKLLSLEYSLMNTTAALGRNGLQPVLGANRFPGRLSQLTIPITAADRKCNNTNYNAGDVGSWSAQSPYSGLYIVLGSGAGSGILSPIGMIRDTVLRPGSFTNAVPAGRVAIAIDSVTDIDRDNLDLVVDNALAPPATNGVLRWIASPTGGAGYSYVFYTIVTTHC